MKIEKVNDNQIRCTLTREDLDRRQIKISEIAYGSEKAKMLFKDMMQQANYEYGFEAEDIPLMIEAIPMSTGCIVFIITKVEDPEELDTRFSKFAPSVHDDEDNFDSDSETYESDTLEQIMDTVPEKPEDVFDLFRKLTSKAAASAKAALPAKETASSDSKDKDKKENVPALRIYSFDSLDALTAASKVLNNVYTGESALYKNPMDKRYHLLLDRKEYPQKDFIKICNLLMEYGIPERATTGAIAYVKEHYDLILEANAVAAMAQIA